MILQLQVTDPEHTASVASTAAQTGDSEIQTRREHASSYEALGRTEKCASSSSESSAEPTNDSEGDADYTMSAGNSVNYSGSSYVDSENDWMTEVLRLCSSLKLTDRLATAIVVFKGCLKLRFVVIKRTDV